MPQSLVWGYVGIILFMLGACIETSWLSSYLVEKGLSKTQVGAIFSLYGIVVAIISWLSGIFVQIFGARKVMLSGVIIFVASSIPFLFWAIPSHDFFAISVTYMLRGMAYPLFCYSFLVWVTYRSNNEIMARSTAWFWIAFNLGLTIMGPWLAAMYIPLIGSINVMLYGLVIALLGAFFALVLNKDQLTIEKTEEHLTKEIMESLLIIVKKPKVGIGVVVKTINSIAQFGFVIMLPIFLLSNGFSLQQWAGIWGLTYIINTLANILFGYIGDKFGWRKTVAYFGGTMTALSCLLIYYSVLLFPGNYTILLSAFIVYAFGLAAFGPLSALMPALAPNNKAAAVSALNLGSGLSNFVGPLIVSLLFEPFGIGVVIYTYAALYLLSSVLTFFLKTDEELRRTPKTELANMYDRKSIV